MKLKDFKGYTINKGIVKDSNGKECPTIDGGRLVKIGDTFWQVKNLKTTAQRKKKQDNG